MLIERIEELGKGKIAVCLDDGSSFAVYRKEVKHFIMKPGAEISEAQIKKIRTGILIPRARKRVLHLLEQMDRTESQLRQKLRQNAYPEDVIEDAISYAKKFHYIDDLRYACTYIRFRSQSKSKRQLMLELTQKGISKHLIEQALNEEYGEEDECLKIQRWLEKKRYDTATADVKEKQKMYQFLLRKGFRSEDILHILT